MERGGANNQQQQGWLETTTEKERGGSVGYPEKGEAGVTTS